MTFYVTNPGEAFLLEAAVGKTNVATGFKLKLFKNNVIVSRATVLGDLTEATFGGYTAGGIGLLVGTWAAATAGSGSGIALSEKASIAYAQQSWTWSSGSETIYGFYITDNGGTVLIGVENFSASKLMSASGDSIKITPILTLSSE